MTTRIRIAKRALRDRRFDVATPAYVWLWTNLLRYSPSHVGVRGSFLLADIAELAAAWRPARARFTVLRDLAEHEAMSSGAASPARRDWILLNQALRDHARTLAWFDEVRADPAFAMLLDREARVLEPLLLRRGRWADTGRLYRDPLRELTLAQKSIAHADGIGDAGFVRYMQARLRERASVLVHALLAAGRGEDAAAIRREALRIDASEEMRGGLERARTHPPPYRGTERP